MTIELLVEREDSEVTLERIEEMTIGEKVDAYVEAQQELDDAMDGLQVLSKQVAQLKKDLVSEANTRGAEETPVLKGTDHEVRFGPRANKTVFVDVEKIKKLLSKSDFMSIVKVGVGDVKRYLTPKQQKKVLKSERSGARSMKVERRA